jgi:hypothetical protein
LNISLPLIIVVIVVVEVCPRQLEEVVGAVPVLAGDDRRVDVADGLGEADPARQGDQQHDLALVKPEKINNFRYCLEGELFNIQKMPLNGIPLGQSITDPINRRILISK